MPVSAMAMGMVMNPACERFLSRVVKDDEMGLVYLDTITTSIEEWP